MTNTRRRKEQTYFGDRVLPVFVRRKIIFGDLISELEWENQPLQRRSHECVVDALGGNERVMLSVYIVSEGTMLLSVHTNDIE